jgi:hypothetical protein
VADLKLVGAVAIKVRPDASDFRRDTQKQVKKELSGVKAEVEVKAKLDSTEAKTDAKKLEKELEGKTVTWNVKLDHDSVRAAQKQFDSMLEPTKKITFDLKDKGSIDKARAKLEKLAEKAKVKITFARDTKGYESVLAKIEQIRRQKIEKTINFKTDDAHLDKLEKKMRKKIAALVPDAVVDLKVKETVDIEYHEDREGFENAIKKINDELRKLDTLHLDVELDREHLLAELEKMQGRLDREPVKFTYDKNQRGLEKAIAEIDAELAKINKAEIKTTLDQSSLVFARARLKAELAEQTVKIEYDENLASLKAAKAKIEALLHIEKLHIETKLDEASLLEALAKANALIETAEKAAIKPKVKPEISAADYLKTMAAIKLLAKNQTVGIFVKLNNASLLLAAAKLTGLRAAARWTQELAKSLGTLDRNLPIVAAVVLGLSSLTSGVLTLTAAAFSLGNGLGEVVRMAGILAPAMILGLGAVMVVFKGVFKDFGAAVNGDTKAIEKLTESGQKAAAAIRVHFQAIRELTSKNFWNKAGDAMLRFTDTALPAVGEGLGKLSTSLGGIFSGILDSFTRLTKQSGVKVFFANLTRGFDVAQHGMADFMDGFNTLAVVGSTMFPRMGHAFEAWAKRFDGWVQRLAADGTLNRWIDRGIQGVKDLFNAGGSLVKVWGNIGQSAQAAGALTLHSFAGMMAKLDQVTAGDRFQTNMTNIFKGARAGSDAFHKALGDLGPAMDVFSVTIKTTLAGAGAALGAFIADIGDIMANPRIQVGMTAFLTGIKTMFETLRPAAAPVAEILQTFGEILGQVATDSGPLFRVLFEQLATVLTTAWHALEPFLPDLIQIGTTIIKILGPALSSAANSIIPAFATAIQKVGDGLVPVVKNLSDFAVSIAEYLSSLDVPRLALVVGTVLSLGGAFKFAATVVPLAIGALKLFNVALGVTAIQSQLMVPLIGILLAALTGLAIGGIAALATSQGSATPFADEYADALKADAEAAGALAGAVGEATTMVALNKLATSGAYDAGKKLGIGVKEVTDAVLKGGPAYDSIQAKINAARDAYNETTNEANLYASAGLELSDAQIQAANTARQQRDEAERLDKALKENRGSFEAGIERNGIMAEAQEAAGIKTKEHTEAQKGLATQAAKTAQVLGAASAATAVLADAFSSSTAKIDAMRKTFEILLGPNAKQKAAETLGAYKTGFNDLKELVAPLAQDMRNLGDAAYGEKGFLNVASGNKAVLQVNQALVDEVNNVWVGAKAAYDAAILHGDNAKTAFQKAQDFIKAHKGDYNSLAEASGVSAAQVQGQWEAVFGHDWVLKVTLNGATEAATRAQQLITSLGGSFDGKEFVAYLDANPDQAMLAIQDPVTAANNFVNHKWQAKLTALPDAAEDTIKKLLDSTNQQWTKGDFQSTLTVAKEIPGLAAALIQINNGVKTPYTAQVIAALNSGSLAYVESVLQYLENKPRYVHYQVSISDIRQEDAMAARVHGRNGAILDQLGRGMHGFAGEVKAFANGGIERHVAQIQRAGGPVRIWAEPETGAEAYIPYASSKRPRSLAILAQVAKDFGYSLTKATEYSNGGMSGRPTPSTHNTASVHIGQLVTADADEAVRKIRISQQDALAVAGISLNGA